jgi:hypothetical protein
VLACHQLAVYSLRHFRERNLPNDLALNLVNGFRFQRSVLKKRQDLGRKLIELNLVLRLDALLSLRPVFARDVRPILRDR